MDGIGELDKEPKGDAHSASPRPGPTDATWREIIRIGTEIGEVLLDDPDQAADVAQDVAFDVWRRIQDDPGSFDTSRPLQPFVFAAVSNKVAKLSRRGERHGELNLMYLNTETGDQSRWMDPEAVVLARQLEADVQRALAALSTRRREAWLHVRERGETYEEAGAALGISWRTVQETLQQAQARLRHLLIEYKETQ